MYFLDNPLQWKMVLFFFFLLAASSHHCMGSVVSSSKCANQIQMSEKLGVFSWVSLVYCRRYAHIVVNCNQK